MKKIILTGESGFIGKAVLEKLEPDIFVTSISRRLLNDETPSIIRYQKDLCDLTSEDLNVFYGVDVVIHCAALAHLLKEDKKNSLNEYRRVNRDATLKLAELAARAKVPRFIYISSIGVNGNKNTFPFLESDIPDPHDSYSVSKFEAEQSLFKLSKETDLEVVIIRPPLWRSTLFYVLYMIVFVLIVTLIYRSRIRYMNLHHKLRPQKMNANIFTR